MEVAAMPRAAITGLRPGRWKSRMICGPSPFPARGRVFRGRTIRPRAPASMPGQAPLPPSRPGAPLLPRPPMSQTIAWADFERVDIRVGTVVDARPFPEARKPAIRLWVDFGGEIGVRKSSAQITLHYSPDRLIGRQVLAVVNFPPRQIGPFLSEVLVLGLPDENGAVVLIRPDFPVPDGGRMQ